MKEFDFYNPAVHKGELPVRVLSHNWINWFENITPNFKEEAKGEIDFRNLKAGLIYHFDKSQITECAYINPNHQIELYENYNQFLWCICYSLLVLFDKGIQEPILCKNYTGKLDFNNPYIRNSINIFNNGFDLLNTYKDRQFYQFPNPEKYNKYDKYYIEKVNAIFCAAMVFILLHEYAHQFLGHLDNNYKSEEPQNDEYACDEYAIDKMSSKLSTKESSTYKFGIIAAISSLIIYDKSLEGGEMHPDIDERLEMAMNKMKIEDIHYLWGVASLTYKLWGIKYNKDIEMPPVFNNYKHLFEYIQVKIRELKNSF